MPVENINRVPVTIITSMQDDRCPMVFAEEMYQKITTPQKYLFVKNTAHYEYASNDSEKFVAEMESIIHKGYVDPTFAYSGAS